MSVNKMGSKLAQGVRQIMEKQVNSPEVVEKQVMPLVAAVTAQYARITKAISAPVTDKTETAQLMDSSEILHPSRVWPD